MGKDPVAIVVDTRTARVFVLNANSAYTGYEFGTSPGPGSVTMLDATTGRALRTVRVGRAPIALAVDEHAAEIYVLNSNATIAEDAVTSRPFPVKPLGLGSVSILDAATGTVLRTISVGPAPRAMVIDVRAHAVTVIGENGVEEIAQQTGTVRRLSPLFGRLVALDTPLRHLFVDNCPTSESNGPDKGCISMLNADTGAALKVWSVAPPPSILAIDGRAGRLVAGLAATRASASVQIASTSTGSMFPRHDISNGPHMALALDPATGHTFVTAQQDAYAIGPQDALVSVLGTQDGHLLSTASLVPQIGAAAVALVTDGPGDHAYVALQPQARDVIPAGVVKVVDGHTGHVTGNVVVGRGPHALALDMQTQRIFVANRTDNTVSVLSALPTGSPRAPGPTRADAATPVCCGALFYSQTHHNLRAPFLTFYQMYGGLDIFGYPRTEAFTETGHLVEYTDRFALQVVKGSVVTAPLGRMLTSGRTFRRVAPFSATATRRYFSSTGHSLSGGFLPYWRSHHSDVLLGPPLAEVTHETGGRSVLTTSAWELGYVARGEEPRHAAGSSGKHVGQRERKRPALRAHSVVQLTAATPVLSYATYLGATRFSSGLSIAVADDDTTYVVGQLAGTGFPVPPKGPTVVPPRSTPSGFIATLDAAGRLLATTLLGGSGQSAVVPSALALDHMGNIYVAGVVQSAVFSLAPLAPRFPPIELPGVFVAKLTPHARRLIYSVYLGAGLSAPHISVDQAGDVYVASSGSVAVADITPGALQCSGLGTENVYVAKLNASGTALLYGACLGSSGTDTAGGIAVDAQGNAYVTGNTTGRDFPVSHPLQHQNADQVDKTEVTKDAFVAELNPTGTALVYSTYLGGLYDDEAHAIAVDATGAAVIAGATQSPDFPQVRPLQHHDGGAFVAKVAPHGTHLVFSTFLGGMVGDDVEALVLDTSGNVDVTGATALASGSAGDTPRFPQVHALQVFGGYTDAFLAQLSADGQRLLYSTYLGGRSADGGISLAVDRAGNIFVAGTTFSTDFPVRYAEQAVYAQTFDIGSCIVITACQPAGEAFLARIGAPLPHVPTPVDRARPTCCGARYFTETGHNLSGPFLAFWQKYGGLDVFGYPRSEAFIEVGHLVQYTDRFELILAKGQVNLATLGCLLTRSRAFPRVAPFASTTTHSYVSTTGHSLSTPFLEFWRAHRGPTLLGGPIDEPALEFNDDRSGRPYIVQWFANGRLEYHPEHKGTRYEVQIGLAGKEALQRLGWLP